MWPSTRGARALAAASALALLAVLALFACWATRQRSPRLYRVALVAPFEGLYRETGYAALDSLRAQVRSLNERLARQGVQYQVWAVDDGNDPALARRRSLELVADPLVLAVVGHYTPETAAAAAPAYATAGLVLVSPVAVAGSEEGQPTTLSAAAPPLATLDAMTTWAGADATTFIGGAALWPAPGGSDALTASLVADVPLLALERALVEGDGSTRRVFLPYTYCPLALLDALPEVAFTVAAAPVRDGSAAAATKDAATLALGLLEAAGAGGRPSRESVAAAARALVAAEGWQQSGPAAYRPGAASAASPCLRGG
jgi:hypothetical protein